MARKECVKVIHVPHCGDASLVGSWINAGEPRDVTFNVGKISPNVKVEKDVINLMRHGLYNFVVEVSGVKIADVYIS